MKHYNRLQTRYLMAFLLQESSKGFSILVRTKTTPLTVSNKEALEEVSHVDNAFERFTKLVRCNLQQTKNNTMATIFVSNSWLRWSLLKVT